MSRVSANDGGACIVFRQERIELAPVLFVLEGLKLLAFLAAPVIALPPGQPFERTLGDVLAVGDDLDVGPPLERFEPRDHRLELHPIIRSPGLAPRRFDHLAAGGMLQDIGPAPGPGIARTGPVGKEAHERQRRVFGCRFGHVYRSRNVIRPRFGSYGETSTVTRSPGTMRMKFLRIRPATWAITSCPTSNFTM